VTAPSSAAHVPALELAAALAEAEALRRKVLEYESAIRWDTSCISCAAILDSLHAETLRRKRAEAELADLPGRISVVIAEAVAGERERADRVEAKLAEQENMIAWNTPAGGNE
jgi:hypothetical protein